MTAAHKVASAASTTVTQHGKRLVYTTPSALIVRLAKVFSVSTLTLSSISTPALMYFWESPAVQSTGINEYMFMTALAASACSTGALHFLLSPFISSIYLHNPTNPNLITVNNNNNNSNSTITPKTTITLETMDLLARPKHTTVQLADLKPTTRFLLTWTLRPNFLAKHPEASSPGRFWLDKRGGLGDQNAMRQIVNVIQHQDRHQRLL
ncbi:hypothetical protein BC941DRAFT_421444 [Chlamydoabsidia padenii]|nr:hypothetical protein BC941DRAFT_421444 [Chlamydoabsidia padenii]